jgi:uncharacterized protein (DUF1919 family)
MKKKDQILLEEAYQNVVNNPLPFKNGDKVILNHPYYPALKGAEFIVAEVDPKDTKTVKIWQKPERGSSTEKPFWMDVKFLKKSIQQAPVAQQPVTR